MGKKIISFSLWGNDKKYCHGAIENAKLAKDIYPDWTCRFYIDMFSVSDDIVLRLLKLGCEINFRKHKYYGKYAAGKFWRHSAMMGKDIERFIVRDADSRLNEREWECVREWEESNKTLHIIRDHRHHKHRIMGGMWGGVNRKTSELDFDYLLDNFLRKVHYNWNKTSCMDLTFLGDVIYPFFKDDMIIHDNFHFFKDENVLPIDRKDDYFIGEIINVA